MPERWEREIRRLREFEPREDLAARVAEGPRGEPPAPRRQRVVAAVTALVVFAAAGAFAVRVFGAGTDADGRNGVGATGERLVLELAGRGDAPEAALRYGEQSQAGVRTDYTWCDGDECVSGHADFAFYPPVSEYLVVAPGTPIEIAGDGAVERIDVTDLDGEPVALATAGALPGANGTYALEVGATWDDGEATFFFGVQTLDGPEAAPDVLHVDCLGPRADAVVVRTQVDGLHVVFENTDGFRGYDVLTPAAAAGEQTTEGFIGVGGPFPHEGAVSIAPGRWGIGCFERQAVEPGPGTTAPIELVDPDDHWASFELACDEPREVSFSSAVDSSVEHDEAAARLLGVSWTGIGCGAQATAPIGSSAAPRTSSSAAASPSPGCSFTPSADRRLPTDRRGPGRSSRVRTVGSS